MRPNLRICGLWEHLLKKYQAFHLGINLGCGKFVQDKGKGSRSQQRRAQEASGELFLQDLGSYLVLVVLGGHKIDRKVARDLIEYLINKRLDSILLRVKLLEHEIE
jgi:hypothetical protein